ncbi:hypothetical protein [Nonomuraea sp. KM88]|uniref:hypothetical protein n=1 Tax=Nonomuraea sp. KM88 TaxID=3457427 RepID=UPI003FCD96D2
MPFDRYNFSPKDMSLLKSAEDLFIHDCMRARGMKWQVLPPAVEDEIEPPNRRRYGVIEPEVARLFGYHPAPALPSVARRSAVHELRMEHLSATERHAAYGKADGCLKHARDRIQQGVPPVDAKLFNKLIFDTFAQSKRDSQVVRAFQVWSACMRDDGLHYPDPLAAAGDQRWDHDEPTQEERRAAQTDVRCKAKSDMISVWSAAEKRLQDAAIRAHPAQFRTLQAAKDRQLDTARRILADQNQRPAGAPLSGYTVLSALTAFFYGQAAGDIERIITGPATQFCFFGMWSSLYAYTPGLFPARCGATAAGRLGALSGAVLVPVPQLP